MNLVAFKFYKAGSWGDHPADPIFEVEAGEVRQVSPTLAAHAIKYGKGEYYNEPVDTEATEAAEAAAEAEADASNTDSKDGSAKEPKKRGRPPGSTKKKEAGHVTEKNEGNQTD